MALKNPAASDLARLHNIAKDSDITYNQLLLLYCQEEFLRRLSLSAYANKLVLKGGLLIYMVSNYTSRSTQDIDFLLHDYSNEVSQLQYMLEQIVQTPSDNPHISFTIKKLTPIALAQNYHGMQAKLVAHIAKSETSFSIDFGVGDVIVPPATYRTFRTTFPEASLPRILTYSLESVIAEKYDAIIQRMENTSRMKDFYDIYYLSKEFSFDGRILQDAIRQTLRYRKTIHDMPTFIYFKGLAQIRKVQKNWENYIRNMDTPDLPTSFDAVMQQIISFVEPPIMSLLSEEEYCMQWVPNREWVESM